MKCPTVWLLEKYNKAKRKQTNKNQAELWELWGPRDKEHSTASSDAYSQKSGHREQHLHSPPTWSLFRRRGRRRGSAQGSHRLAGARKNRIMVAGQECTAVGRVASTGEKVTARAEEDGWK